MNDGQWPIAPASNKRIFLRMHKLVYVLQCTLALQGLSEMGYELISTGGTHSAIEKAGVAVKKVEEVTGFPEMLDGETVALIGHVHVSLPICKC